MTSKKRKASDISLDWDVTVSKSRPGRMYYFNKIIKQPTLDRPCKKVPEKNILAQEPQANLNNASLRKRKLESNAFEAGKTKKSNEDFNEGNSTYDKTEISTPREINTKVKKKIKIRNEKKHEDNLLIDSNISTQIKGSIVVGLQGTKAQMPVNIQGKNGDLDTSKTCEKSISLNEDYDKCASKIKSGNLKSCGLAQDRVAVKFELIKKENPVATFHNKFRLSRSKNKKADMSYNISKEKQENIANNNKRKNSVASDSSSKSNISLGCSMKVKDRVIEHIKADKKFQQSLRLMLNQSCGDVNKELLEDENSVFIDEEMDWEPSEQEIMIEHLKSLRENWNVNEEIYSNIASFSKECQKDLENNNLILVVDTNVFITCLPFIKGIQDTSLPGLGLPTIYIPWRVLHELDHLKRAMNKQLQLSARKAIRYINDNFSSRHRRITGQSFEEYSSMRIGEKLPPDDEILKICLNLKMAEKRIILITNDKNLESKAIISKVEAYTKNRFIKEKLGGANIRNSADSLNLPSKKSDHADSVLFIKLKYLLQNLLEEILKTELINAFGEDWSQIISRKPPWTLNDIFECFIKHWFSVFTFVFKKDVLLFIKNIKNYFLEIRKTSLSRAIESSRDLLVAMRDNNAPKQTSYNEKLIKTINEVESLNKTEEKPNPVIQDATREKDFIGSSRMFISESSNGSQCNFMDSMMFDEQQCRLKVKTLFQAIWESVKNYCSRLCELVSTGGTNSSDVDQVKFQYPNVIRALQELMKFIEKIVCSEPEEVEQSHQLIQEFTNLLVNLNVFQVEASEMNNLSQYIRFFCCDNESRAVLRILMNDLRQFAWQITISLKSLGFL